MRKIAVMSAKGGVGKSSTSALLSCVLSEKSKVLLIDFDITGPTQHEIFKPKSKVTKAKKGLNPVELKNNLHLLTMGSLVSKEASVIWRGPKKLSMLDLFYDSIEGFDIIVVDMPPGISEEHKFLVNKDFEAIFVTTSQNIALDDTLSSIDYAKKHGIKILGLIENMSGFVCENCKACTNIFGKNGGRELAEYCEIPLLASFAMEPAFCDAIESEDFIHKYTSLEIADILRGVVRDSIDN